jgi:peptide chain release factor 2
MPPRNGRFSVFSPCKKSIRSNTKSPTLKSAPSRLGGTFDFDTKSERLVEVLRELENPKIWDNPEQAQALGKERGQLEMVVNTINELTAGLNDAEELLAMAVEEGDADTVDTVASDLEYLESQVATLEFRRMFSGEMDANNAFLDIQAGSGGTEAQDWASMIERMYLRWGESKGFKTELIEESPGDVAGIKSATIKFEGEYAFGWLRTETGVHRLVRKSPFDSGNRRHTSFASVFVSPEVDDNIDIEINPADLRVDVYRASGAGGQHINRTESAVRITHNPTGIVVQCQSDRSQHKNRDTAMKQLKAKLYELEMMKRSATQQALEDSKSDIGWGSQIRSYVLDQSRIKDLRTGVETGNPQAVLDGNLDMFIEASLKSGL